MTRQEHLMTIAAEECMEVAQRLSKAIRFGMDEVQPGQTLINRERIMQEYYELRAVLGMACLDAWDTSERSRAAERAKVEKVESFLRYSADRGTLQA